MKDVHTDRVRGTRRGSRDEPKFLAVDFFCGAGGTARGLIDAGGYVIAGIDKDPRCEKTFVENNVNIYLDQGDPRYLTLDIFPRSKDYPDGRQRDLIKELTSLISHYREGCPRLPLLFAICAPCQPFTRLSRKELTPERKAARTRDSNLLNEALKFVRRFSPELVLSENVAGINNPRYGGVWESFQHGT